jgi:hypothetical protein
MFYTVAVDDVEKKASEKTLESSITNLNSSITSLSKLNIRYGQVTFESLDTKTPLTESSNENKNDDYSYTSLNSGTYNTAPVDFGDKRYASATSKSLSAIEPEETTFRSNSTTVKSTSEMNFDEESEVKEEEEESSEISGKAASSSYFSNNNYDESAKTTHSIESMPNLVTKSSEYNNLKEFSSVNERIMTDNITIKYKRGLRKSPLYVSQFNPDGTANFKEYERKKRRDDVSETDSNDTSYESGQIQLKEGSLKSSILNVASNKNNKDEKARSVSPSKRVPNSTVIMMYREEDDYVINSVHREPH